MLISYNEYIAKYKDNFIRVEIEFDYYNKIVDLVSKIIAQKSTEQHHIIDNRNEFKRFTTGFLGEAALETILEIPIIDWSIGDSKAYHHPDIPGYNLGIKTVEYGKFPVIFKNNSYPQIICIRSIEQTNVVFVCGLAEVAILKKYQSDELIVDPFLRKRGTKTGFYGFGYLKQITSINDISQFKKEY